jgi:hypothetical protein
MTRFRIALILAIVADVLQVIFLPFLVEGVGSPADDLLDFGVGGTLIYLLGWHWEFLPSFVAKLVPGVDLVPLWTIAVANVYRKSKRIAVRAADGREAP